MRTCVGVLLVIATIIAPPVAAKALMPADATTNSITITQAFGGGGSAGAVGTYTIASGYTFASITINVMPAGGAAGEGGTGSPQSVWNSGFSATIAGVPAGTYDVQAMLTVLDGSGNSYYFFSNTATNVTVFPPS